MRAAVALLIGLAGALLIWVVTPYNDLIIGNSPLADDYLPVSALFLTILLVLGVNPLLRRLSPSTALNGGQLAMIMGILLVACVVPGQALMRSLPYMVVKPSRDVRVDERRAADERKTDLPPSLFPDKFEHKGETPIADDFVGELEPGKPIPWRAWVPVLLSWGPLVVSAWLLMVGLALIVLYQWRHNERLNFPLLKIQKALIQEPEAGRAYAPLFRSKAFWYAAGAVFVLHALVAAKQYFPGSIPAIPLRWNLRGAFTEEPWRSLPGILMQNRIYFTFIGVAFFMQTRISFSIWFFVVAYGVYQMIGFAYLPPFSKEIMTEHRIGAMISIAAFVLWMGRAHWARVGRSLFRRASDDNERRNRTGGWMFLIGCAGVYGWLLWAGLGPGWAAGLVVFVFLVAVVLARFVAETGMPLYRMYLYPSDPTRLLSVLPFAWLSRVSIFFSGVFGVLFIVCSRTHPAVMTTHALSLDDDRRPRGQVRMAFLFLSVMVLGLLVSGVAHVRNSYRHSMTLNGVTKPINASGLNRLDRAHRALVEFGHGQLSQPRYNRPAHLMFGMALGAALYWLCLRSPAWPLHPMGIMVVYTYYGNTIWPSILVGWLLKVLLVKYGGARIYRRAQNVFLGLIIGELFAAIVWAIVPVILAAFGEPYKIIRIVG